MRAYCIGKASYGIHKLFTSRFYVGEFEWGGETLPRGRTRSSFPPSSLLRWRWCLLGTIVPSTTEHRVSRVMNCAHDGCMLTGEVNWQTSLIFCVLVGIPSKKPNCSECCV